MRNPVWPSSCVTPAGTSNELDVQNEWEENTHTPFYDYQHHRVDAPRDFLFLSLFSPNEQRARGEGGGAARLFFFFFFSPVQQTTSERDWPPCKVVFFELATNALNVRNNINNNNFSRSHAGAIYIITRLRDGWGVGLSVPVKYH